MNPDNDCPCNDCKHSDRCNYIGASYCIKLFEWVDSSSADIVVTSPPYNVGKEYEIGVSHAQYIDINVKDNRVYIQGDNMTTQTQEDIATLFNNFKEFLLEKNRRYGDSAIQPVHIFSKVSAEDQIKNRLDDKLSRIMNSDKLRKNDCADVLGYTVLLMVQNGWLEMDDLLD